MKVFNGKSDELLEFIRDGRPLTGADKLNLIVQLSIPSILAQITSVVMFFIDQAMVGHLGEKASAACGLVETSTWLLGSLTGAASMGFSVQVAHFIGANDFVKARQVFRHALVVTTVLSLLLFPVFPYLCPFRTFLPVEWPFRRHAQMHRQHAHSQPHQCGDVCA